MVLSNKRITKSLIRLRGCAGWTAHVLFANHRRQVFSRRGPIYISIEKKRKIWHLVWKLPIAGYANFWFPWHFTLLNINIDSSWILIRWFHYIEDSSYDSTLSSILKRHVIKGSDQCVNMLYCHICIIAL